ncbi:hypothetical protein Tco_1162233 [Tanacetum coccineum]
MGVKPRILWKNLYGEATESFRAKVTDGVTTQVEDRTVANAKKMWNILTQTIREAAKETSRVIAWISRTHIGHRESQCLSKEEQIKVKAKETRLRELISMRDEDGSSIVKEEYRKSISPPSLIVEDMRQSMSEEYR